MKNEYIIGLEKELDSLIDDNSKFVFVGNDRVKVLIDKITDYPTHGLKIKMSKNSERYLQVEQRFKKDGKVIYGIFGRNILGLKKGDLSVVCDHINRNPLDNRRVNLRAATRSQNSINRVDENRSGYKHVYFDEKLKIYSVEFSFRIKRTKIGKALRLRFGCEERASGLGMLADCISVLYDREYSVTNFDKSIYSEVFIDTYLKMYGVDKGMVLEYIALSKGSCIDGL